MLVKHLDVEADALFCGECVHVAADRIHLASNIFGGTVLRSLEHHVLDEVGNSVPLEVLIAGARLIQIPIETERMCCISSVMRVSPLGKTSRRILRVSSTMASSQPASRRSARKRKPLQLLLHTRADVREYILALQNQ